jgi:hypothetical protein
MSRKLRKSKKSSRGTWARRASADGAPRCGLCGKAGNLTKTECCGQWICDDEDHYVLFSYARNSCYCNHSRYTLCAYHFNEGHSGDWQTCAKCRADFEDDLEMYVYYGTNEYNFEQLKNPPQFKPTYCSKCGARINKAEGGFSSGSKGCLCESCTYAEFPDLL